MRFNPGKTHPTGKGGKRADLGNAYFRSRWEANWARYLNWLKKHGEIVGWEFEPDTFEFPVKRGNVFYTPDFKVTNKDGSHEYHEVKGWMDANSKTKMDRMARYYPSEKVLLVDRRQYQSVARKLARVIPFWEHGGPKHGWIG